ncbi:MAG: ATP-dependent sacrificial sulfur transferase LarE [Desulforhopalus sp.]|nr:ATP-dependent sacrificial sulfur transferase LarE [Desulforhopalus sp.]
MEDETLSVKESPIIFKDDTLKQVCKTLLASLRSHSRVAVAFSGGVDSTLLLKLAVEALGAENVVTIHGKSILETPARQIMVQQIYKENFPERGELIEVVLHPLLYDGFAVNDEKRCYICKKHLYISLKPIAASLGVAVLLDGTNKDDLFEARPGLQAVEEEGILTPLADAAIGKAEVRQLAEAFHLSNYLLPSDSCLATRLPQGKKITREALELTGRAETALKKLGLPLARVKPVVGGIHLELWGNEGETAEKQSITPEIRAILLPLIRSESFSESKKGVITLCNRREC